MPRTRITLFGALEVAHGQAAPQRPPTQKVLSLLGYLIARHDIPQARDKLVDLLWPELLPRQGRRMLSDTLWRARRLLTPPDMDDTPCLTIGGNAVTFRPDTATWVDMIAFERSLGRLAAGESVGVEPTESDLAHIREAVALYRGDFLEDCYDDWAVYERERLRELYLGALRRLLAHDIATRAYDSGLQIALRLVRADPLREEGHRDLMRLYYLLGREADALRAYEQCRKLLDEELGIEPDPETISLYEEIESLQRRRAWEQARLLDLPPAPSAAPATRGEPPLVGRQEQRAELMEAIERAIAGAGGMALVAGEAGLGKSRLLREIAAGAEWRGAEVSWGRGREDAQALPFGALREALAASITPIRARQLAEALPAYALGGLALLLPQLVQALPAESLHTPQSSEHQVSTLHAAIVESLLALGRIAPQAIILEDIHWFDPATLQALTALLPALHNARVLLVISGRADELSHRSDVWNTLLQLDRTGLLRRIDLRGLSEEECADLVRRILRMRHPAPRFSARLHQATGGNPFFILQALRSLQEQGMLTRDEQGTWHTPWDAPDTDYHDLPLPAGLHDVIDVRLRELAPHERAALAAAAVLGQNFAPTTWAEMTNDERRTTNSGLPFAPAQGSSEDEGDNRRPTADQQAHAPGVGGQWSGVINQLLRRQFLIQDNAGYRFGHETLREVIYGELDEPARQTLHLRAAEALEHEHYARVEALAQHLYLAGAWDKSLPYLVQSGDRARAVYAWQDALRCYDQALEAANRAGAEAADPPTCWGIQLKRGEVATLLGDYPTAVTAYNEVLRLAERDADAPDAPERAGARRGAQIQALNGLSYIYGLRNDYARAHEVIQQGMALATESPRLLDRAEVFYQAGLISFRIDDYAEARRYLQEALQLYNLLGLEVERAKCLSIIGWSYLRQDGPTDQVIDHFKQALEVYRRQSDRFGEHSCLVDITNTQLMRGRLLDVVRAVEQCLPFFQAISAQDSVSECLFARGEAYRRMGLPAEALESLRESQSICIRLERNAAAAVNQIFIAATIRDMGHYDEALDALEGPLRTDDRLIKGRALLIAADISRIEGQVDRAWIYLEEGFVLGQWLGSKAYIGIAFRLLAQLRIADTCEQLPAPNADLPDAETSFAESIRLLREAHYDDELALTYLSYGQYLLASERQAQAKEMLGQARVLMQTCGMEGVLASVQELLDTLQMAPAALLPGQQRVLLARRGTPRGRPLRADELVEVIWTVDPAEQNEQGRAINKVTARQERLRRLCHEAAAQGAEPTVSDLAETLGVAARTVDRDIATLRAAGEVLVTRGASG